MTSAPWPPVRRAGRRHAGVLSSRLRCAAATEEERSHCRKAATAGVCGGAGSTGRRRAWEWKPKRSLVRFQWSSVWLFVGLGSRGRTALPLPYYRVHRAGESGLLAFAGCQARPTESLGADLTVRTCDHRLISRSSHHAADAPGAGNYCRRVERGFIDTAIEPSRSAA